MKVRHKRTVSPVLAEGTKKIEGDKRKQQGKGER